MDFEALLEKIKNPLRKQALEDAGKNVDYRQFHNETPEEWKAKVLRNKNLDPKESIIRNSYLNLNSKFPDRAKTYLDQMAVANTGSILRTKLSPQTTKIYERNGVQVFTDEFVDIPFDVGTYNYRIMVAAVDRFLSAIGNGELLPNRRPKIIISNKNTNPRFKGLPVKDPAGIYRDRLIYIDQVEIQDPSIWVHEYAHFIVDLIPKQTEPMLDRAYKQMLDFYWRKLKKKRESLVASNDTPQEQGRVEILRKKIAKKLGFPAYGLSNRDEFFAVLLQHWNDPHVFPNNAATYKYKQLVKNVLSRL